VFCRMATFPITLTDPKPGFQRHRIFDVEYLKYCAFYRHEFL